MPRTARQPAPPPRAAVYVRISSDRDGDRLGVKRQEKECRAICDEHGWEAVVFADNDVSAANKKVTRPRYEALLDELRSGELTAVVCWDLDRLTRQPVELEAFLAIADEVGLRHLVTVAEHVDPAGGDGLLVARIKAAVAAEEIAKTKKRLKLKRDELADAGKYSGGAYPFGRGPGMAIREDEAAIIREAARRVLAGESFRRVAMDLSDRGLGPRSGGRWPGGSNLAQRITAPHIAGLRQHRGKIVGNASWKPILNRTVWERLVALRSDPSRRTRSGAPARMLLTGGVTRCGKCGRALRARPSAIGTRRYGCPPEGNHGYGCGGVTRVAEPIDAFVVEAVLTRLECSDLGSLAPVATDLAALDDELSAVDAKLGALASAWAADTLTQSEWDAARAGLTQRRSELEHKLAVARRSSEAAAIAGPSVREAWDKLDLDAQRRVIAELLPGGVTVHPIGRGQGRGVFDPTTTITLGWEERPAQ